MSEKAPSSPTLGSRPATPTKQPEPQSKQEDVVEHPGTAKLLIVMTCLYLTIFLMALVRRP